MLSHFILFSVFISVWLCLFFRFYKFIKLKKEENFSPNLNNDNPCLTNKIKNDKDLLSEINYNGLNHNIDSENDISSESSDESFTKDDKNQSIKSVNKTLQSIHKRCSPKLSPEKDSTKSSNF